jgi:hypothetical protein
MPRPCKFGGDPARKVHGFNPFYKNIPAALFLARVAGCSSLVLSVCAPASPRENHGSPCVWSGCAEIGIGMPEKLFLTGPGRHEGKRYGTWPKDVQNAAKYKRRYRTRINRHILDHILAIYALLQISFACAIGLVIDKPTPLSISFHKECTLSIIVRYGLQPINYRSITGCPYR